MKELPGLEDPRASLYSSWRNRDIAAAVAVSEPTVTRTKATGWKSCRDWHATRVVQGVLHFPGSRESSSELLRAAWRENLISCVKRSTLGSYALARSRRSGRTTSRSTSRPSAARRAPPTGGLKTKGGVTTPGRGRGLRVERWFLRKVRPESRSTGAGFP